MGKKTAPPQPALSPASLGSLGDLLRQQGFRPSGREASPDPETSPSTVPDSSATADVPALSRCAKVALRRERKGRGGHVAVVIAAPELAPAELEDVAGRLRKALGCGARAGSGTVVVQGDVADRVREWLERHGACRVVGP